MPDNGLNNIPERTATIALLSLLCLAGLWLRLRNLGALGLVLDEGVQALAVRGILEHGVPITDSGMLYARSLSFLYAQALFAWLFELNSFWLRLPAVLFGVGCIAATYLLAEALFDRRTALLAAALMAFSQWEIEMSRYARFYTAFQMMYTISLLCFYRGIMKAERGFKLGFVLSALATFTTHFMSRILVVNFAIPFLSDRFEWRRKLLAGFAAVGVYLLWMVHGKLTGWFAMLGTPLPFPQAIAGNAAGGLIAQLKSLLYVPLPYGPDLAFFNQLLSREPGLLALPALPAAIGVIFLAYWTLRRKTPPGAALLAVLVISATFCYQYSLAAMLLLLYLALYVRGVDSLRTPVLMTVYLVCMISGVFWMGQMLTADPPLTREAILAAMGSFPNLMRYFLHRFASGWPVMCAISGIGGLLLLYRLIRNRQDPAPLFLLGALLIPLFVTGCFEAYAETRYFFHLYPLIVSLFAYTMLAGADLLRADISRFTAWQRKGLIFLAAAAVLFISQDANPLHAWEIGERTYTSRKDPIRSITNLQPYAYFHQDQETPSQYLRERRQPGDRVAVFGSVFKLRVYQFYLGKVDYLVTPNRNQLRLRDGKLVTPVTGSEVVGSIDQFRQIAADSSRGLWVLGDRLMLCEDQCHGFVGCGGAIFGPCWDVYPPEMRAYLRDLAARAEYVGEDGETFVVKIF